MNYRFNQDNVFYNNTAKEIMKENDINIIDLRQYTIKLWVDIREDHVHFKNDISKMQAEFIFSSILKAMNLPSIS